MKTLHRGTPQIGSIYHEASQPNLIFTQS